MMYLFTDVGNVIQFATYVEPETVTQEGVNFWNLKNGLIIPKNDYTLTTTDTVPNDHIVGKYCFVDGQFVLNPNYTTMVRPIEELQAENEELKDRIATQEEQLVDTQLALTEQYETNLILEDEMLSVQMALVELYEGMEV